MRQHIPSEITARRGSSIQGVAFQITEDFANYGYLLSLDWSKCFDTFFAQCSAQLMRDFGLLSVGQTSVRMSGLINSNNSFFIFFPRLYPWYSLLCSPLYPKVTPWAPSSACCGPPAVATLSVVRSPLMLPLPNPCCLWMIVLSSPSLAASAQRSSWFD